MASVHPHSQAPEKAIPIIAAEEQDVQFPLKSKVSKFDIKVPAHAYEVTTFAEKGRRAGTASLTSSAHSDARALPNQTGFTVIGRRAAPIGQQTKPIEGDPSSCHTSSSSSSIDSPTNFTTIGKRAAPNQTYAKLPEANASDSVEPIYIREYTTFSQIGRRAGP